MGGKTPIKGGRFPLRALLHALQGCGFCAKEGAVILTPSELLASPSCQGDWLRGRVCEVQIEAAEKFFFCFSKVIAILENEMNSIGNELPALVAPALELQNFFAARPA